MNPIVDGIKPVSNHRMRETLAALCSRVIGPAHIRKTVCNMPANERALLSADRALPPALRLARWYGGVVMTRIPPSAPIFEQLAAVAVVVDRAENANSPEFGARLMSLATQLAADVLGVGVADDT